MTRSRKALILRDQEAGMSEAAAEIAEALTDVAAAICFDAATKYQGTVGEQRQIAAVMFHTAQKRFGGIKYEGKRIEDADIQTLDAMWQKLIGGRPRR